jgi:hypothetical protein
MFPAFLSLLATQVIATGYTIASLLATHFYRYSLHANIATGYTDFQYFFWTKLGRCGNLFSEFIIPREKEISVFDKG